MDRCITLKKATIEDKEILKHLWDLYSYDFSVYDDEDTQNDGRYLFYYDDGFFENDDRCVYFIMVNDKYAGFASISSNCYILNKPTDKCIVDFFVLNKYRHGGIGKRAAYLIFDKYPTRFEVAQYNNNESSKLFWERIISEYTDNHYEIRKVFTRNTTLQAIIFDAISKENAVSKIDTLNQLDSVYRIKLYSRPNDGIKLKLLSFVDSIRPLTDNATKNLRRDMDYQDVITIEDQSGVLSLLMHTSYDGIMKITFSCLDLKNKHICDHLLQALKTTTLQNGFEAIYTEFDSTVPPSYLEFYAENNFNRVEHEGFVLFQHNISATVDADQA